jgi:hypothetical protein
MSTPTTAPPPQDPNVLLSEERARWIPLWDMTAERGGAEGGRLIPPPFMPVTREEYARYVQEAEEFLAGMASRIRDLAAGCPLLAPALDAKAKRDANRSASTATLDEINATAAHISQLGSEGRYGTEHRAESNKLNELRNQLASIEQQWSDFQNDYSLKSHKLLNAVKNLACEAVTIAQQTTESLVAGWRQDETLADVKRRVGAPCLFLGRLKQPKNKDEWSQLAVEDLLGEPMPAFAAPVPETPRPAIPDFGASAAAYRGPSGDWPAPPRQPEQVTTPRGVSSWGHAGSPQSGAPKVQVGVPAGTGGGVYAMIDGAAVAVDVVTTEATAAKEK